MEKKLSGPRMQQHLQSLGLDVRQVVLRRENNYYVAEFYQDRMQQPVQSSAVWAQAIQERLRDVTIIDRYDTIADWRPGKPVIWASVTFKMC